MFGFSEEYLGPGFSRSSFEKLPERKPKTPKRKAPHPRQDKGLRHLWREYCEYTSIPGVRYLSGDRPTVEKLLWATGLVLALLISIYLVFQEWQRRCSSPVLLAMAKSQQAVWEVPFPAVTICPLQKVTNSEDSREEIQCTYDLLCERNVSCNVNQVVDFINKRGLDTKELLLKGAIFLNEVEQTMKPILVKEGLCQTFNMAPGYKLFAENTFHRKQRYWDIEDPFSWDEHEGYTVEDFKTSYPRRANPGREAGILTIAKLNKAQVHNTSSIHCVPMQGFEIKVHSPYDMPNGDVSEIVTAPSYVQISVKVQRMTSDDLRHYTPEQRQCYYPDEKQLRFFRVYTRSNCEQECLSRTALSCCGCVAFHMPREVSTPVCSKAKDFYCLMDALDKMRMVNTDIRYKEKCGSTDIICNCLPSCEYMHYESHVSEINLDNKRFKTIFDNMGVDVDDEMYDFTIIRIYYPDFHFVPYHRIELYGNVEFIANIGGLLGLGLGLCALSVVEFIYWLFMRPVTYYVWHGESHEETSARPPNADEVAAEEPMTTHPRIRRRLRNTRRTLLNLIDLQTSHCIYIRYGYSSIYFTLTQTVL